METKDIPVELILEPKVAPRWGLEGEALRELADDIAARGLLQPIAVVPEGERYRLIAGNRRLHACQDLLGWDTIPAVVHEADMDQASATAAENLHRLNLDPVEEALLFASILQETGESQAEVARRINKSRSYVAKRLMLLDLDDHTLEAIIGGEITWTHGLELRRLEDADRRLYYLDLAIQHGVNVRVLRAWIDEELARPPDASPPPDSTQPDVHLEPIEYQPMTCLLCGRPEDEIILTFVPICQPDKQELERLLSEPT